MNLTSYPLVFDYRDPIVGNGFVAGVMMSGRALMIDEIDENTGETCAWIDGVTPGGFGAGGASQKEAAGAFRQDYLLMLYDIASESKDFAEFTELVHRFFANTDEAALQEWNAAVQLVRSGKINLSWLNKKTAAQNFGVSTVQLHTNATPEANSLPIIELAAA